jgi:hypothetical protein
MICLLHFIMKTQILAFVPGEEAGNVLLFQNPVQPIFMKERSRVHLTILESRQSANETGCSISGKILIVPNY